MIRDESDEDSSVQNCSYLVSRDSLFHFLHVKSQLELSRFILQQILTAAVVGLIRNSRFRLPVISEDLWYSKTIRYNFPNKKYRCVISEHRFPVKFLYHVLVYNSIALLFWFGLAHTDVDWLTDLWPINILIRRKAEVMLSHGLFSLLTERLMLHSNNFSMTTYNVLFEVSPLHTYTLSRPVEWSTRITITSTNNSCCYFVAV